ncbi:MAG: hypothetical protein E3J46_09915 [Desulfobacteraceae bacterium]|nr:MAG: hypothetical protein E3J46_09915 [Desulfobacteraceae bacterium]
MQCLVAGPAMMLQAAQDDCRMKSKTLSAISDLNLGNPPSLAKINQNLLALKDFCGKSICLFFFCI